MFTILTQDLGDIVTFVVPLALFFLVIYFFVMKPDKKRRQQILEMQAKLQIDDKIITIGGIHGIVAEVKEDTVTIIIASGAKMKIEKGAIKTIVKE